MSGAGASGDTVGGVKRILSRILKARIVAIMRGIAPQDLRQVLSALSESGIFAVEVALNSDAALESIEVMRDEYSDRFVVGAGTVLDSVSARSAILAGADFLLSPVLSPSVVETCLRYSKLPVPGVLSPSEVLEAHELGCSLVKVFPAGIVGPRYIRELSVLSSRIHIMPVGGVGIDNAGQFFDSGASVIGVGSQLVNPHWVAEGRFDRIAETARVLRRVARPSARA